MEKLFSDYVGRTTEQTEVITAAPVDKLAALLDRDDHFEEADEIPVGAHWLYFLPTAKQANLDIDGHPLRGDFLPPVDLPRRMWAGSRIIFGSPLRVGDRATKRSEILKIEGKAGRSGQMVFVTVRSTVAGNDGLAVTEEQDLVYRGHSGTTTTPSAVATSSEPAGPEARRESLIPTPALLFRFSALTFNAHRIHYDRDYAREQEGYPDLVVHGPLTATLLLDLIRKTYSDRRVRQFQFRGQLPLFVNRKLELEIQEVSDGQLKLRAISEGGHVAMSASARLAG